MNAGAFQPGRIKVPSWFQRPSFLRPGLFELYPSSLSKSVGFVSLSGKASLVSISAAILFLRSWHVDFPLEFEFRGKKVVLNESMSANIHNIKLYLNSNFRVANKLISSS